MNKTKTYIAAAVILGIGAIYLVWSSINSGAGAAPATAPAVSDNNTSTTTPSSSSPSGIEVSSTIGISAGSGGGTPGAGQYKDGTYKGSVADAYYGNIQVQAVISGGKISDVQTLQSPNGAPNSVQINANALPKLTQEAIVAQSANVDIVSGATQTSEAFQQSLGVALTAAKA